MARRNQRRGDWLATDDYTGATKFASQLRKDFWGNYAARPLQRNVQEIASPINDPAPVPFYRGPSYEATPAGIGVTLPQYIGYTTVPTHLDSPAIQALGLTLDLGIPDMAISTTFVIR